MRSIFFCVCLVSVAGCGQEEVVFPEQHREAAGECGAYYPGGDDTSSDTPSEEETPYGVEEGKIFPCAVWESARLAGQDTYINVGEQYLATKHGASDRRSLVFVLSAEGCSQCALLIRFMAEQADAFDEVGAMMIGMARAPLGGDGPDFTIDEAAATLVGERWPADRWYIINDEEYYFDESFESNNPWLAVVALSDMRIVSLANDRFGANASGVAELLELLESL